MSKLGLCIDCDCVRCGRSKPSECIGTLRCCGDSLYEPCAMWLVPHLIVVKSETRCGGTMSPSDSKRLTSIWRDCDISWSGSWHGDSSGDRSHPYVVGVGTPLVRSKVIHCTPGHLQGWVGIGCDKGKNSSLYYLVDALHDVVLVIVYCIQYKSE